MKKVTVATKVIHQNFEHDNTGSSRYRYKRKRKISQLNTSLKRTKETCPTEWRKNAEAKS